MKIQRRTWFLIAILGCAALLAAAASVRWSARRALSKAAADLQAEQNLEVDVRPMEAPSGLPFERIGTAAEFTGAAEFQGHLYLCGPAGLTQYDSQGKLERTYRVGAELPPSPVTRMAVGVLTDAREPELIMATAREGLVAFDGEHFRRIYPRDAVAREITALLPLASGRLLIGTEKAGVMVYDGRHLTAFHITLANMHVTELAGDETDLWVGTLDRGVLHYHAGQTDTFSEGEGLSDPQVTSLLVANGRTFVGTPLGVTVFENGRIARTIAKGAFAQALGLSGDTLLVGTMDQGVLRVAIGANVKSFGALLADSAPESLEDVREIFSATESTYAIARGGVFELESRGAGWKRVLEAPGTVLADGNISALGIADGKVWVGYFDHGLDVLEADEQHAQHVEDQHVFCVNRIAGAPDEKSVAVATANGLVVFDRAGRVRQVLSRADGLIADHVTDVGYRENQMVAATPAGITFFDAGGARSIYAFEGLINNHVYALGISGEEVMAGTLGGLSRLEREKIVENFSTANSTLPRNWISAVAPLGHDWMIGTYGGGVARLDEFGHFHSYDVATGEIEINPNAMLATDEHVFAGSLGRGLFVYDRATERWKNLREGLPSLNVTAFAAANGFIYIGTDNGLVRIRKKDIAP